MDHLEPLEKFKLVFFQECDELLGELETRIGELRAASGSAEALNAIFRALHTIKGGAGMFGFSRIARFAHAFENVLDRARAGAVIIDAAAVAVFLHATDVLADLVQATRGGEGVPEHYDDEAAEQLNHLAGEAMPVPETAPPKPSVSTPDLYRISFRPKPQLFRNGSDPLLIFRHLRELGKLAVEADMAVLPPLAELDPPQAYLAWRLELETSAGLDAVRQAFEFVAADCDLEIVAPGTAVPAQDDTSQTEIAAVRQSRRAASIRVDLDRIDRLVNMVGEIAIVQASITQQTGQVLAANHPQLVQDIGQLFQLTQMLQDSVMAIRAIPVGSIFARMPRLVRELASATGKRAVIETKGEDTEIDKTVIEELGDPLLHMIRNAVDHGIETPDERKAAGKRPDGRIGLSAFQRGGQIVIEVTDDGRGIDRDKVKRKAIERNLIPAGATLGDDEITNLIFLPGFSTADKVTDISGRGVGMDVVRRNIQKLGGRVSLQSELGKGSKLTITLPLTLAILPGMIVRAGNNSYVIPLPNIIECLQVRAGSVKVLPEQGEVLRFRDRYIPLIRLGEVFNITGAAKAADPLVIVVNDESSNTLALAVDEITGQQQVVIKSLRKNLDPIPGLAGATILGDGKVALILVLTELHELHWGRASGRLPPIHTAANPSGLVRRIA